MHDRTKMLMQNANAKELVKKGLAMFEKKGFRCCFSKMISKSLYER
jgi:hypothetical protein